ncbi:uncharacterized protein LOC120772372 [Bactrocera tryoni]|uniref:uncharacterized protein LOC120772372 n=1 Tax=Bactrocera tryoni TaxID=59916 RepID=UPI001A9657C2|nr:uncharacterized protein LOC120772372 [Bactrocera tryoni]
MLKDLQQLYEMHAEELEHVKKSITIYLLKIDAVYDKFTKNKEALEQRNAIAMMAYDKYFTILSNMLEVARKFNFHLFVNDLDKKSTRTLFEALESCEREAHIKSKMCMEEEQLSYDYKNLSILPAEENEDIDKEPCAVEYFKKDISIYKVGGLIKASVTYILDLDALYFYICDAESKDFQQIANLKSMIHLKQHTGIPAEDEVFGLVLDNTILRAIRIKSNENKTQVLLLDFGETATITEADVTYRLPTEMQRIPAQAMLCKLTGINGQKNIPHKELQICLQELEYESTTFILKSKIDREGTLVLKVYEETSMITPLTPSPASIETSNNSEENVDKTNNTNPFKTTMEFTIDDSDEAIPLSALPNNPIFTERKGLPNGLTAEEMDILAEEPLNTSNAMKAVLGYNPKDEKRLCRFYDPKTGACFKGANCRLEHSPSQPEGWTKDNIPTRTIIDDYSPVTRYSAGHMINITVTHVGHIEYFHAQINDPENIMEPLIWNDDDIPQSMHLTKPPLLYDLVRAQYEDGLWYRAKIMDFDESAKVFKVFYVDYGNYQNVMLKQLAYCERSTEHFPFQAVLCRLADIMHNPEASVDLHENGIRTLNALILNHSFDVKVVSHDDDLIVRFMGAPYSSFPKRLISMGCAKQFHSNVSNDTKITSVIKLNSSI